MARFARATGLVETDDHVPCLDPVAVADMDLADHAAGRMLNLFHDPFDSDDSAGHDRARELRADGKAAQAEHEEDHARSAHEQMASDGCSRLRRVSLDSQCPPQFTATRNGVTRGMRWITGEGFVQNLLLRAEVLDRSVRHDEHLVDARQARWADGR